MSVPVVLPWHFHYVWHRVFCSEYSLGSEVLSCSALKSWTSLSSGLSEYRTFWPVVCDACLSMDSTHVCIHVLFSLQWYNGMLNTGRQLLATTSTCVVHEEGESRVCKCSIYWYSTDRMLLKNILVEIFTNGPVHWFGTTGREDASNAVGVLLRNCSVCKHHLDKPK